MDVVRNRVDSESFSNTVCSVVTSPNEFSWYDPESMPRDPILWLDFVRDKFRHNQKELHALERSLVLARKHLEGGFSLQTAALYYMTPIGFERINSNIESHTQLVAMGDHLFIDKINWR